MDDRALLAASASGDAEAFAAFYRRHLPLVIGFAFRATRDREAAADLVGEVFAAALAGCARYRPQYETAAPWLIGIANNKLRESERRGRVQNGVRHRLQMRPLELAEDDLERVEAIASAAGSDVLAAVEMLPAPERDAVRARVIDGRDYRELAQQLECSESVVRRRVSRGLGRVRKALAETSDQERSA